MSHDDLSSALETWVDRGTPLGATLLLERVDEQLARPVTPIREIPPHPARGSFWGNAWAATAAAALVLVVIGGWALLVRSGDDTAPVVTEPTYPSTSLIPATTLPLPATTLPLREVERTETTVAHDDLGLRVPLEVPNQTRAEFLAGLDAEGWVTYTDEVVGWSIRYPADWTIGTDTEPGRSLVLLTPESDEGLILTLALDAAPADASSYDYHVGYIETAVAAGVLYPPFDDQWVDDYWTPMDVDFDGRFDRQDITAVDLYRAVDDAGTSVPDGHPSGWFWSYAYYDPAAQPAYAYWFETFDVDWRSNNGLWPAADSVVTSFEPPDGYP